MKTKYINQLPLHTQQSIKADIIHSLSELNLSHSELLEALENAMSSRIIDLEDTININKYLN